MPQLQGTTVMVRTKLWSLLLLQVKKGKFNSEVNRVVGCSEVQEDKRVFRKRIAVSPDLCCKAWLSGQDIHQGLYCGVIIGYVSCAVIMNNLPPFVLAYTIQEPNCTTIGHAHVITNTLGLGESVKTRLGTGLDPILDPSRHNGHGTQAHICSRVTPFLFNLSELSAHLQFSILLLHFLDCIWIKINQILTILVLVHVNYSQICFTLIHIVDDHNMILLPQPLKEIPGLSWYMMEKVEVSCISFAKAFQFQPTVIPPAGDCSCYHARITLVGGGSKAQPCMQMWVYRQHATTHLPEIIYCKKTSLCIANLSICAVPGTTTA